MKKLFLAILIFVLLLGFFVPGDSIKVAGNVSHLFLFYLDGDNDLEHHFIRDFNILEYALFEHPCQNVKIIVLLDTLEGPARIFEISPDENLFEINSKVISELGEVNMGDPKTLEGFIISTIKNYPGAKCHHLIFSDHGLGVEGLCWDDSNEILESDQKDPVPDHLTLSELKLALNNAKEETGIIFDIIGFDCCLMGTIEVAYTVKDYAKIMVASESIEYIPGWFLKNIFSEVLANPKIQPKDLAKTMVKEYGLNHYEIGLPFALAAIDLEKISPIVSHLCQISQQFTNILEEERNNNFSEKNLLVAEIYELRAEIKRINYFAREEVDFYDLAEGLKNLNIPPETVQLLDSLESAIDSAVISKITSNDSSFMHGLSIRFFEIEKIPQDLDFPQEWTNFLNTWLSCWSAYENLIDSQK